MVLTPATTHRFSAMQRCFGAFEKRYDGRNAFNGLDAKRSAAARILISRPRKDVSIYKVFTTKEALRPQFSFSSKVFP